MSLFEANPETWKRVYLYGERLPVNRGMAFGRMLAEGLERDEATGDPVLDLVAVELPKYELMDIPLETVLGKGKNAVPILIKPDSMKKDGSAFIEYKTGQSRYTKKQVDEHGQITFYATGLYLEFGRIPSKIDLVHVETRKEGFEGVLGGKIVATGAINVHPTTRDMRQVLKMMARMRSAWEGIKRLTAEEIL